MAALWIGYAWAACCLHSEPLFAFASQYIVGSAALALLSYGHNGGGWACVELTLLWLSRDADKIEGRTDAVISRLAEARSDWWVGIVVVLVVYSHVFLRLMISFDVFLKMVH
jgi:hypothetical protein